MQLFCVDVHARGIDLENSRDSISATEMLVVENRESDRVHVEAERGLSRVHMFDLGIELCHHGGYSEEVAMLFRMNGVNCGIKVF